MSLVADIFFYLQGSNGLVVKSFIQTTQYFPEQRIIMHAVPDRLQQVATFGIHVTIPVSDPVVNIVKPDYGKNILYALPCAHIIFIACRYTIPVFCKKRFAIIPKAFMYPHVSYV